MSPSELKDQIEALLSDLLGTYTFTTAAGGLTTPAIAIDDGTRAQIAPDVSGLECIIQTNVSDTYTPYLNNTYGSSPETLVILKQWDISANTLAAIERLKALPNLAEIGARVLRNSQLDNVESVTLTLRDFAYSG